MLTYTQLIFSKIRQMGVFAPGILKLLLSEYKFWKLFFWHVLLLTLSRQFTQSDPSCVAGEPSSVNRHRAGFVL